MTSLLLALALSTPARAWVVDLGSDPVPIGTVDGQRAYAVDLPSVILAERESLRLMGRRGATLHGLAGFSCTVPLGDGTGTLNAALDECRQIYSLPPGGWADFSVQAPPQDPTLLRLRVAAADPHGSVIVGEDGALFLEGPLVGVQAATLWVGGHWETVQVDDATRLLLVPPELRPAVDTWLAQPEGDLVVRAELEGAPREQEWRLAPQDAPLVLPRAAVASTVASTMASTMASKTTAEPGAASAAELAADDSWCVPEAHPAAMPRTFLLCLDAEGGPVLTRRYDARGAVVDRDIRALPTGTYLEVVVRHPEDTEISMELADDRGRSRGEELVAPLADAGALRRRTTRRLFAPRAAGTVAITARSGDTVVATEELQVVDRYVGAIRMGVGLTLPAQATYASGPENDAGTAPIIRTSNDIVDGEIVVGFAPFLEPGGRDDLLRRPWNVAPLVALGVVSANGGNVRFTLFQSFYAGAELELTPNFAIGAALTLRRVDRLAAGYQVDDLLPASDVIPTASSFRPGLGLVIGMTPNAMRLRARSR